METSELQNFDKEKTLAYIHPSFYDLFVCLFRILRLSRDIL